LIAGGNPEAVVMGLLFGGAAVLLAPVLAASPAGWLVTARGLAVTGYQGSSRPRSPTCCSRGLRTVSARVAVTIGLAEPAVAALLGLIVLGERLSATGLAGLALIGFALIGLGSGRTAGALPPGPPG
jgi:drug/metabolite transporter, DME family